MNPSSSSIQITIDQNPKRIRRNSQKSNLPPSPRSIFTEQAVKSNKRRKSSIITLLIHKELTGSSQDLLRYVERLSIFETRVRNVSLPFSAKCTIAVAVPNDDTIISTHGGDHAVRYSSYLTGKVNMTLNRHERTPWAIAFHSEHPELVATGCLQGSVCLWRNGQLVKEAKGIAMEYVTSLTFNRRSDGEETLLIALGSRIWCWNYLTEDAVPFPLLQRLTRVQCITLTPRRMMVTAEQSFNYQNRPAPLSRIFFWEDFCHDYVVDEAKVKVLLSDVVIYSDGGMSVSSCGRFLATIHATNSEFSPFSTPCEILIVSLMKNSLGETIRCINPEEQLTLVGVTSIRFSPTDEHIVCGYGVNHRPVNPTSGKQHCLSFFSNYSEDGSDLKLLRIKDFGVERDEDGNVIGEDVNVALFHPRPGYGVIYATRQGPLKILG